MHPYVRGSSVHNTQDVEATSMSISKLMAKEDVLHAYNGVLLSHKKRMK